MNSDYKRTVFKGLKWSGINEIATQSTTFILGIFIARILNPQDFGLIGMVTAITGFATVIKDFGLSSAIIQKKETSKELLSTIFWTNIMVGVLLTALVILMAPFLAIFYGDPRIESVAFWLSFNFTLSGASILLNTKLTKELDFKNLFKINFIPSVLAPLLTIVLALNGFGYWSLIIQNLFSNTVGTILVYTFSKWRPSFVFSFDALKEVRRFSAYLTAQNSFNYWTRHFDNILIGRYLDSASLGYYSKAYGVMMFPINHLTSALMKVLFPSLSVIQEDNAKIKHYILKASRVLALIIFPLMFGFISISKSFVVLVYGDKWSPMVPVLQVLCVTGARQGVFSIINSVYLIKNKTDLLFKWSILFKSILILGMIVGLNWGIVGVAIGYTLAGFLINVPNNMIAGKLIGLSYKELIYNLLPIMLCSGLMVCVVFFIDRFIQFDLLVGLIAKIAIGAMVYFLFLYLFKISALKEVLFMIKNRNS